MPLLPRRIPDQFIFRHHGDSLQSQTPHPRRAGDLYSRALLFGRKLKRLPRRPDPDTVREIAAVCRWLEHWLNEWELLLIAQGTRHYFRR